MLANQKALQKSQLSELLTIWSYLSTKSTSEFRVFKEDGIFPSVYWWIEYHLLQSINMDKRRFIHVTSQISKQILPWKKPSLANDSKFILMIKNNFSWVSRKEKISNKQSKHY